VFAIRAATSVVNRYYDPTTDQFLTIDPDVADTDQPYVFTNDDPLNAEDPPGEDPALLGTVPISPSNSRCSGAGAPTEAQLIGCEDYVITGTPYAPTDSATAQWSNAITTFGAVFGMGDDFGVFASSDDAGADSYEIADGSVDHMFRDAPGHLMADTPETREIITQTANNPDNFVGTRNGVATFRETLPSGEQAWAEVYKGEITNGGVNRVPR
jgi:hypothetical protein